ncbi:MAG: ATP-binding protein [Anaerolineae bacterium]|nr:ATP-binding protein [Anaerolineae bacterium]
MNPSDSHTAAIANDLSLMHIQAKLACLDIVLRREVRRWQLAGQDPSDAFRGLYVSNAQAGALLSRPLCTHWGQEVVLEPDEASAFIKAVEQANQRVQALVDQARAQGVSLRLESLATTFHLDHFDQDVLLLCIAPLLDLRYEQLYGYLQDNLAYKRPSVNLVLDLLCEPGPSRLARQYHFAEDAPLLRYHLIEPVPESAHGKSPLLAQTLAPDEAVAAWLLGRPYLHSELAPYVTLSEPQENAETALLASEIVGFAALWRAIALTSNHAPILALYGPDRLGQDASASLIASRLQRPLLTVDLETAAEAEASLERIIGMALRDARLLGAVPYFTGWDTGLVENATPAVWLDLILSMPDIVFIGSRTQWLAKDTPRRRRLLWVAFPIPDHRHRRALWEHFLNTNTTTAPKAGESVLSADEVAQHLRIDDVAGQFELTAGQVRDAVAAAQDLAFGEERDVQSQDLLAAARSHSSPRLSSLARKITPRYGWDDIVLPEDQVAQLHEIVVTVRRRPQVLDEWGVGKKLVASRGVTVLFAGPPGTGKTMAAEIIAAELGLDLYKIDLSTIVSKYVGETEKNLERIFSEATTSNAILFFDEADALFGKRSEVRDAHDRYANIEISYLLQRMEAYDGVTILATNLRGNLDEAFTRRLQFSVEFPFPEAEDRRRIWKTLFPPDVPHVPELDFDTLAQRFKLAGGNIRNALVSAAYMAADDGGQVTMAHLLHGTYRELEKMGKLVTQDETM